MKDKLDAMQEVRVKLENCPACGGVLEHPAAHKLQCVDCGMALRLETFRERAFGWGFVAALTAFGVGVLVVLL